MTVKLKTITETAWLVLTDNDDTRVGLLTEIRDNYILMAKGEKKQFLNRKEVNKYFNEDIFNNIIKDEVIVNEEKIYFIKGYPIDFADSHEIILKGNDLPLFTKKITSEIIYAAGYYCLNFERNWMPAFSPKLSTLETYEYSGPHKTELQMKMELAKLRKEKSSKK
jgi:hypothetical protein